jgi:hypothetical protein
MVSPSRGRILSENSRGCSRSPIKSREEDLIAGLSSKMGELLLTDKEATWMVIKGIAPGSVPRSRWEIMDKVCS